MLARLFAAGVGCSVAVGVAVSFNAVEGEQRSARCALEPDTGLARAHTHSHVSSREINSFLHEINLFLPALPCRAQMRRHPAPRPTQLGMPASSFVGTLGARPWQPRRSYRVITLLSPHPRQEKLLHRRCMERGPWCPRRTLTNTDYCEPTPTVSPQLCGIRRVDGWTNIGRGLRLHNVGMG